MKLYAIQSKNGIMMSFGVSVKKIDDWYSCRNDFIWNPSTCDCACNNTCKIDEYLDIKH